MIKFCVLISALLVSTVSFGGEPACKEKARRAVIMLEKLNGNRHFASTAHAEEPKLCGDPFFIDSVFRSVDLGVAIEFSKKESRASRCYTAGKIVATNLDLSVPYLMAVWTTDTHSAALASDLKAVAPEELLDAEFDTLRALGNELREYCINGQSKTSAVHMAAENHYRAAGRVYRAVQASCPGKLKDLIWLSRDL